MDDFLPTALGLGIWASFCVVGLLVMAALCYFVMTCYEVIPQKHRKMEPPMVWLSMIPLVNLVWNFFVFPGLSDSFKAFFEEQGKGEQNGSCGRELALAFCILPILGLVPCIGLLFSLAGLVVLIIYLVKVIDLKRQVVELTGSAN